MTVRAGLIFSAAVHLGAMAWVLLVLGGPKSLNALPEQAMEVDVVTAREAAQRPSQAQQTAAVPEKQQQDASRPATEKARPEPDKEQSQPQASPQQPALARGGVSTIDAGMLSLYNLRPPEMDSKADSKADLSGEQVAAFKARLRSCWRLPAQVETASRTRVLLRIFLAPDGALGAEPMLVEASASADGPAVYQAAMAAVARCAPFSFLPRERYDEWKVLEVGFSPREMAGG